MRRVVVPSAVLDVMSPGEVKLGKRESHYIRDVLRLNPGEPVMLIDGTGMTGRGEVRRLEDDGVVVYLGEFGQSRALESPLRMTMMVGVPKGNRWDFILQKCTELGVDRIIPVYTRRSEVRIPEAKVADRLERWSRIAAEAARQCGRSLAPEITAPADLRAALRDVVREWDVDLKVVADASLAGSESSHGPNARLNLPSGHASHVVALIGPEGGLEEGEVAAASNAGFQPMSLGPRVLRAETAAVVMVTLIQHRLGDLQ